MPSALLSNPTARGLSALYVSTFFSGAWAMIIPTIPVLARQFDVSAGGAAQIITAFAIGKLIGTVVAGVLLDRMGTRIALVGGPLIASVAALAVTWTPWLLLILILSLIMGAADSLWATRGRSRASILRSKTSAAELSAAFMAYTVSAWRSRR